MNIYPLRLTLMNHMFYHTENTNGVFTRPFIGDLALTYAFRKVLVQHWEMPAHRKKPEYEEIADWGFYVSVAQPVDYDFTEVYTRNTLFNVDGYIDTDAITKSSKSPFKNLYYTQGVAAGSTFECVLYSRNEVSIPSAIRIGTGRETLVKVEPVENLQTKVCLNIYTQQQVFKNLDQVAEIVQHDPFEKEYILEQYVLLKHLSKESAKKIMHISIP